jgi:hypothetical protein
MVPPAINADYERLSICRRYVNRAGDPLALVRRQEPIVFAEM